MRLEGWNESVLWAILRDGRARARPPQDEVWFGLDRLMWDGPDMNQNKWFTTRCVGWQAAFARANLFGATIK
jgi:hypothetical protein